MDNVELKLSESEYKMLIKLLYFADYFLSEGLFSTFRDSGERDGLSCVLTKIYKLGDKFDLPEEISLTSIAGHVRFTDEEALMFRKEIESEFEKIAYSVFAQEFAKRDLHFPKNDDLFDHEGGWLSKRELILDTMRPYIHEFEKNGVSNLRFRPFHKPRGDDGDTENY